MVIMNFASMRKLLVCQVNSKYLVIQAYRHAAT